MAVVLRCGVCGKRYQYSAGSSRKWCALCRPKVEKAASMVMSDEERELYRRDNPRRDDEEELV